MSLQVVGAGLGRTGTHSLKIALEQLLGAPCYHMIEVFSHPDHVPLWSRAIDGDLDDWDAIFGGYAAAVDWPAASFWREMSEAYPDAIILLSVRDVDSWWKSASNTIFDAMRGEIGGPEMAEWHAMVRRFLAERFTPDIHDEQAAKAAYLAHNEDVRKTAPKGRLLEYRTGDGWEPLCDALGVPVPDVDFPHVNTTDEFRAMAGLDQK
jgi:hypothetical protein